MDHDVVRGAPLLGHLVVLVARRHRRLRRSVDAPTEGVTLGVYTGW